MFGLPSIHHPNLGHGGGRLALTPPVSSTRQDEVDVVLWQYCKMTSLAVEATDQLIDGLMYSLPCTCEDLPVSSATLRAKKKSLFSFRLTFLPFKYERPL